LIIALNTLKFLSDDCPLIPQTNDRNVVPMTTDRGQEWADINPNLYVRVSASIANLKSPSIALLDQVRAIDISRIVAYRGSLTLQEYEAIAESLQKIMEHK